MAKRNMFRRGSRRGNNGDWETVVNLWGGSAALSTLAPGNANFGQVQGIVPAVAGSGVVPLGRMNIGEVEVYCSVPASTSPGAAFIGFGLFKAEWDTTNSVFTHQFPCLPTDACRDNWMQLEMKFAALLTAPTITQEGLTYHRKFNPNITLGQGEALLFVIHSSSINTITLFYNYAIRSKIRRVM